MLSGNWNKQAGDFKKYTSTYFTFTVTSQETKASKDLGLSQGIKLSTLAGLNSNQVSVSSKRVFCLRETDGLNNDAWHLTTRQCRGRKIECRQQLRQTSFYLSPLLKSRYVLKSQHVKVKFCKSKNYLERNEKDTNREAIILLDSTSSSAFFDNMFLRQQANLSQ